MTIPALHTDCKVTRCGKVLLEEKWSSNSALLDESERSVHSTHCLLIGIHCPTFTHLLTLAPTPNPTTAADGFGSPVLVVGPDVPSSLVVFMHGLGDTARGWEPVADMLAPRFPTTRFILPTATSKPVTLNGG